MVKNLVSINVIQETLKNFKGVEHRLEYVNIKNGVAYYNDSISTTPGKALAALSAFEQKIILIAGGSDKNLDYLEFGKNVIDSCKYVILLGATKDKIKEAIQENIHYDKEKLVIKEVKNLEQAVNLANEIAKKGDVVVMSPASASFDMFKNYKQRGKYFKELVESLS